MFLSWFVQMWPVLPVMDYQEGFAQKGLFFQRAFQINIEQTDLIIIIDSSGKYFTGLFIKVSEKLRKLMQ